MKFAKDLERELVPEWRAKYLNYKSGKKKVKAIARALRHVEQASWTPGRRRFSQLSTTRRDSLQFPLTPTEIAGLGNVTQRHVGDSANLDAPERSPLRTPASRFDQAEGYGSIVPPRASRNASPSLVPASLKLPEPAIDPDDTYFTPRNESATLHKDDLPAASTNTQTNPKRGQSAQSRRGQARKQIGDRRPTVGTPGPRPSFIHRIFSSYPEYEPSKAQVPAHEQALAELRTKETEFFAFMDKELAKIEAFYKLKEDESTNRLNVLRDQLHVMRDTRMEELRMKKDRLKSEANGNSHVPKAPVAQTAANWTRPLTRSSRSHMGKTTKAMTQLATPRGPVPRAMADEQRDFVTRPDYQGVPYNSAKRKLKLALLEFYRGLELLKSYADLNRKAFRKMNKKYDKMSYSRPTGRYMTEKVNKAWFVQSDVVENHLVAVEDLYARYFERGNRKVATRKLRGKAMRSADYSQNSFRSGLLLAAGLVFAAQGLSHAVEHLVDDDLGRKIETSYLLQWRLLLAGLYPVEFRDFFLGDMYCSQTYAMGNIALFFCLYANKWGDPPMCNSSHSRALGFVTTVPSIWRGFQCLRRYYDTRNAFPHLVNFGKYSFSILYYLTLSLYRIDKSDTLRAIFITFACLNAIYSSVWDLAMDWSLCNPYSKNPYLRDFLGFRRRWVYYAAMAIDPILRFNWILYAIFINDIQHSAVLSFAVSLSEVFRRGIWTIFRVENEHCTNVGRFRASRDIPLPYDMSVTQSDEEALPSIPPASTTYTQGPAKPSPPHPLGRLSTGKTTALTGDNSTLMPDLENGEGADTTSSLRRRRFSREDNGPPSGTLARVGSMLANAHAQDFERKKRPGMIDDDGKEQRNNSTSTDEDEEEEEEEDENESNGEEYGGQISEESDQSASHDKGKSMLGDPCNSGNYGGSRRHGR
ncbi:uncharacterized protein GIQ15_06657 [Arthroderma uncinatum]|uniref:uncharacterized protein n=1 Tax=Arthroderma uncinatum TaxID=74035 RepID=UPI00144A7730|nr:uncharacterized protein GIQ15_06657 [Arthroderma uncinatum]KAF3479681.1 hypothetical protein GIQ15_06657 [Arthroderma uncinatum]